MTLEERKHQEELIRKHARLGFEAVADAQVHFMIEDALKKGLYEAESLENLTQALAN